MSNRLQKTSLILCCSLLLFISCNRKQQLSLPLTNLQNVQENPYIGTWRISRFPALDNITPAFDGKYNPLYSGYFFVNSDGSLRFSVEVTNTTTKVENTGYWELAENILLTKLVDQDHGGYINGKLSIAGDYMIYEVDGEMAMILIKQ